MLNRYLRFKRAQPKTPPRCTVPTTLALLRTIPPKTEENWRQAIRQRGLPMAQCRSPRRRRGRGRGFNSSANRPIVIWIHGGSNVHGSAAQPLFSGEYFATSMDCVFVGVNYRVGLLSQLAIREGTFTTMPKRTPGIPTSSPQSNGCTRMPQLSAAMRAG